MGDAVFKSGRLPICFLARALRALHAHACHRRRGVRGGTRPRRIITGPMASGRVLAGNSVGMLAIMLKFFRHGDLAYDVNRESLA